MSHDAGRVCLCRSEHRPAPLHLQRHHILPTSMGGGDDPGNLVFICPTTHANVHKILDVIVLRGGALTWDDATALFEAPVSRYAFALAHEGWRRSRGVGA